MALIKKKLSRGIECEYWAMTRHITDKIENKTYFMLCLYKDEAARRQNISDYIFESQNFNLEGILAQAECFAKLKESDKKFVTIQQFVPAVLNDNGEIITPEIPLVIVQEETNWFADAEDVL